MVKACASLKVEPVKFPTDHILVAGGLLPAGKVLPLPVVHEEGVSLWTINVKGADATSLLGGAKGSALPLGKAVIWQRLRHAILAARSVAEQAQEDEVEDLWAEPSDQANTRNQDSSKGSPTGRKAMALLQRRLLTIELPRNDDDLSLGTIALRVRNSVKSLSIECTPENLHWLASTVQREVGLAGAAE